MHIIRLVLLMGILLSLPISSVSLGCYTISLGVATPDESQHLDPVVLITGFEPFDEYEVNPAQIIAETLDGQVIDGATIVGISVPVNFTGSVEVVTHAIECYDPLFVISIGLAARSRLIRVENAGLNLKRGDTNDSRWFRLRKIDPCGPLMYTSSLPTRDIVNELQNAQIPARGSCYGGFYICNALLYGVLSYISTNDLPINAGFIHIPVLSTQDPKGLELKTILDATIIAVQVCLNQ